MNRRSFLKRVGLLASIPFINKIPRKQAAPLPMEKPLPPEFTSMRYTAGENLHIGDAVTLDDYGRAIPLQSEDLKWMTEGELFILGTAATKAKKREQVKIVSKFEVST